MGTDLEVSSLLAIIHSALVNAHWMACHACYWSRKAVINFIKLWTLWAMITIGLAWDAHGCNGDMTVMGVTGHFLIGYKLLSTRLNSCLVLLTGPNACSCVSHRLCGRINYYYSAKWTLYSTSKFLPLYPWISTSLNSNQRNFIFKHSFYSSR